MTTTKVSIGQVNEDIAGLVNRVTGGGEQIILTSRGQPKAVLVSWQDFEKLNRLSTETDATPLDWWAAWQAESDRIGPGSQLREGVPTLTIADRDPLLFDQGGAGRRDGHTRQDAARAICDAARDARVLCERWLCEQQQAGHDEKSLCAYMPLRCHLYLLLFL